MDKYDIRDNYTPPLAKYLLWRQLCTLRGCAVEVWCDNTGAGTPAQCGEDRLASGVLRGRGWVPEVFRVEGEAFAFKVDSVVSIRGCSGPGGPYYQVVLSDLESLK